VVNADQRIEVWNAESFDLWGLRANEVEGSSFMALDIGLAVDRLAEPLRETLAGRGAGGPTVLDAVNRRGKSFQCVVQMLPIRGTSGATEGAVILMGDAESVPLKDPKANGGS